MSDARPESPEFVLRRIFELAGIEASVSRVDAAERIQLEVSGEDSGLVIGKQGSTLDALQLLVNKAVFRDAPDAPPVWIDAEGYRGRRAENLVALAKRLAGEAIETGRRVAMAPMSPADRRTVHMAIGEMEGVTTQSEGEGAQRRLVIIPQRR